MRLPQPAIEAVFVRRTKRFFVDALLADGSQVTSHCPNTGSLLGCLEPGRRVWLRDSQNLERKLRYTFQAIQVGRTWVNVDTSLPNALVHESVTVQRIPELTGYASVRREVAYGRASRIDLLLESPERPPCYVEVKNTTLVENGVALFPDAVTERGLKHLEELMGVVRKGGRAVQFFLVSRADAHSFAPAERIDPAYAKALRRAKQRGVEILAYSARPTKTALTLLHSLPVHV